MAQKPGTDTGIRRLMKRIPDSLTWSAKGIADYVQRSFPDPEDRAKAIFIWITGNIHYDFKSIVTNSFDETPEAVSERLLKERKGVCLNFAYLYSEITNLSGVKSYVIQGYTRQNGRIDPLPHLWCATQIKGNWYFFDPTWGSGYIFVPPREMIWSHMPFDPMWQFLENPVSHEEFRQGYATDNVKRPVFNYSDTLKAWENASELSKVTGSLQRIKQMDSDLRFVQAKTSALEVKIENMRNEMAVVKYNSAVMYHNMGIDALNTYIKLRGNIKSDSLILWQSNLLDSAAAYFSNVIQLLNSVTNPVIKFGFSPYRLKTSAIEKIMVINIYRAYWLPDYCAIENSNR